MARMWLLFLALLLIAGPARGGIFNATFDVVQVFVPSTKTIQCALCDRTTRSFLSHPGRFRLVGD